jgi:hypothetical protein
MVTKAAARADRSSTGHSSTGRIVPLFRPYRLQVAAVIVLIELATAYGERPATAAPEPDRHVRSPDS